MAIDEETLGVSRDYLLTETTIAKSMPVAQVLEFLQARKTTGQVTLHMSQGTVQKMGVVEKSKVTLAEAD